MIKKILLHGITVGSLVIFIVLGLASASTTPSVNNNSSSSKSFFDFFEPFKSPEDRGFSVIRLKNNEEPQIRFTSDLENENFEMLSNYYVCLGTTGFNGISKDDLRDNIISQCKRIGATMALYSVDYTHTTSSGYRRYDYLIYYFVKFTDDVGFGINLTDLTVRERQNHKRNTGAVVSIVYKRTPAFYANIFRGDIIVKINDIEILDVDDGILALHYLPKGDTVKIEILRDGKREIIQAKY